MRLTKQTVKQLAFRARKPKSTLHDWYTGRLFPGLDDITPLSRNLNCPEQVILGFEPCQAKCPDCEQSQPGTRP